MISDKWSPAFCVVSRVTQTGRSVLISLFRVLWCFSGISEVQGKSTVLTAEALAYH